jgi:hypothetical protein
MVVVDSKTGSLLPGHLPEGEGVLGGVVDAWQILGIEELR